MPDTPRPHLHSVTDTGESPIWNVVATVVDLVPAATAEEAVAKLHRRLEVRGFTPHHDPARPPHAMESEPLDDGVETATRAAWRGY